MDITKCEGTNCPLKENCFRFTAPGNPMYQSYFVDVPFKDHACEMFWGKKSESIFNQLKDITNGKT
jgi:hypothetical protein